MIVWNYRRRSGGLAISEEKKRLVTPLISLIEVEGQI